MPLPAAMIKPSPIVLRPETNLSRRYLRVIEKWIPTGVRCFNDWPVRPDCGHFLGGCHWYGIESIGGALAFAAAASSPEYDPAVGGATRDELRTMARKAIRYLCFTHDSGPADCVRPAVGLGRKENWGTKWGERGLGFFRESQCGTTISGIAVAAQLLGDVIDEETWTMIATMHADYAARFGDMAPKSGLYVNTQMEENGWTSCGLASVSCLLAADPQAAKWAATARQWMFSTATTPQDAKDLKPYADNKTIAQWTWETFTTLPDFMAENHGMVHPSYTAAATHFTGYLGVIYGAFGLPMPEQAFFNRKRIYAQLKRATDRTGSLHPVQGMDWPYLFTDPGTPSHAAAAVLLRDPDAARLERRALATLEARQTSNGGRMISQEIAEVCHDIQDPMIIREWLITTPTYTYLIHRLHGDGPAPTPEPELERKLRGVRVFPHSGFVLQRHPLGQTSFAWRNCLMALPLTADGIQTVAPATNSWLAHLTVKDRPDSQEEISIQVDTQREGFAAALVMDRAQGSVRQEVLYAGLPDGTSLSFERWTAREAVEVSDISQGFLRIINEKFSAMKDNCHGHRVFTTPEGATRFEGFVSKDPASDIVRTYDHPAWVNVDDRLGIVFRATGETVYHNRHYFNPWWAVADDLTLSRNNGPQSVKAGAVITQLAALIAPGQSAAKTAATNLTVLAAPKDCVGLIGRGHLAAANFGTNITQARLRTKPGELSLIPVFEGTTRIANQTATYPLTLQPGQAVLRKAVCAVKTTGTVELTASASTVVAHNPGKTAASVTLGQKTTKLRPGQTLKLK
ncbi:MAG: hypothetical protein IPN11_17445 [Opitutaceae bacterium]|nr:hypothetical protein [Opitutaceae bacterium]